MDPKARCSSLPSSTRQQPDEGQHKVAAGMRGLEFKKKSHVVRFIPSKSNPNALPWRHPQLFLRCAVCTVSIPPYHHTAPLSFLLSLPQQTHLPLFTVCFFCPAFLAFFELSSRWRRGTNASPSLHLRLTQLHRPRGPPHPHIIAFTSALRQPTKNASSTCASSTHTGASPPSSLSLFAFAWPRMLCFF
jgi:hypothetical protein